MDKEFVEQFRQGDTKVFRQIVEDYQVVVINTCASYTRNRDEAHDLAQEVFIKAYQSAPQFRGDSTIKTWLTRIAINTSLNYLRAESRKPKLESIENEVEMQNSESSEDILIRDERSKAFYLAIDSLPENQRLAFELIKLEMFSYREAAEIMNISLSAIEALVFRAKIKLKTALEKRFS